MRKSIFTLIATALLFACEDPIDFTVDGGTSQLAVDAFLNDQASTQQIILKKTKSFFGDESQEAVTGAQVVVTGSDGNTYNFTDPNNDGIYEWQDTVLVHEGITYSLSITTDGKNYTAEQTAQPVPIIDSIVITPLERFDGTIETDSFQAEFYAIDIANRTDYYWIKAFRNDTLNNSSNAIIVTEDAAFGPGADGTLFIPPLRSISLNTFDRPHVVGDKLKVELWSVNADTRSFFQQTGSQINNGGLFATPPTNVRTNIASSSDVVEDVAVGFFDVSLVSSLEKTVQ